MSGVVNKIKDKVSGNKSTSASDEQQFSIQPHPAKSNNPHEVEGPQLGGGLNSNPEWQAHQAKGPYQPSSGVLENVGEPTSREQLKARSAELNQ